jgi:ribosomal protein S12 methylthiotransferase accessory factor YcaO
LSFVGLADDDDPVEACIGVGATEALARSKCHGEGIERFRLGDADPLRLVSAAEPNLKVPYLAGDAFIAYRSEQRERLGLEPYSPEAVEQWITGFRWDGTRVAVPACLVWCPFPRPRWLAHGAQSSNGAAAWGGLREARRRAWLELVERDAFIRMWRTEAVPERIMPKGLSAEMRDWLSQRGIDSFVLKLAGPFEVSVACAIGISESHLCIGAAAGSASEIVDKAMFEVVMQHLFPATTQVEAKDVSTPSDHAAFWSHRRDEDLERVLSGPKVAQREDEDTDTSDPMDSDAVFVTLANRGIAVVKALSPNLVPMTFGFDAEPLATYRSAFGFDQAGPLTPHPFA